MTPRTLPLVLLVALASGCDFHGDPVTISPEVDETSSFETGLDGWIPLGVDLIDPAVTWSVARSTDQASDGAGSVRLQLDNLNGQGKIFLEKEYDLAENQLYTVEISFDLASADFAGVEPWRIIAGAGPASVADTRSPTPQGDTGNGLAADEGYRWGTRSYTMQARASEDGELFVHVGVWGTSLAPRSYFVDELRVELTREGLSADLP